MKKHLCKFTLPFVIVILLTCCTVFNAHAQSRDSLLKVYNTQTIHSFGKSYVKGGKSLSFADLKPEFNGGIAKDLYKKSKGNLILSRMFTVTSVAALVTGAILNINDTKGAWVFPIVGLGLNLGSLHFKKQSTELVDRAIWYRNKEILFGVQE
ncbi:MAG TPA: hypothetical protein VGP43_05870 [Chitinophagaceae bacterium]|nr:hypothetical protein [Chitinophagaceae bacterium]